MQLRPAPHNPAPRPSDLAPLVLIAPFATVGSIDRARAPGPSIRTNMRAARLSVCVLLATSAQAKPPLRATPSS